MHPPFVRAVVAALAFAVTANAAEPELGRAKDAYDRGVRAHAASDYTTAARAFAEADAIAPTAASLEAALESAMRADDVVLGQELLDRAATRPSDASLAKTVESARRRFAGRTGKVHADCMQSTRCLVAIDGVAVSERGASRAIYVKVGPHNVVVQRDDDRFERLVEVGPDETAVVRPSAAPEPATKPVPPREEPHEPSRRASGISPAWFFLGLGATVAGGIATTISGLNAVATHDRFEADGCGPGATGPRPLDCDARASDGESAKLRTNILLATTGALAVVTAVTGAFFVRWSATPSGGGGMAMLGARLP